MSVIGAVGGLIGLVGSGRRADRGVDGFEAALQRASGSGEQVRAVGLSPGVKADLTASQMERIARAVDEAERQGSTRALVLIDGLAVAVDVTTREILGAVPDGPGLALPGIDAVVRAAPAATVGATEGLWRGLGGWRERDGGVR